MRTEKEIRAKTEAMKKKLLENVGFLPLVRVQVLFIIKTLEWVLDDIDYKKRAAKLLRDDKWLFDLSKNVSAEYGQEITLELIESLDLSEWEELRAWSENELMNVTDPSIGRFPFPQSIIEASQKL